MKHPAIPLTPVKNSSNVKSAGYDPVTRTLAVEFKSGGIYHYADVPAQQHTDLMAADSFGSHLAKHILKNHRVTHINPKTKD